MYPEFLTLLVLFAVMTSVTSYRDFQDYDNHKYCEDLSPYHGELDLDQIKGVWYGVEKILHAKGEYRIEYNSRECFYIDIKEKDIVPVHDFDESSILGMWYIHEYVNHEARDIKQESKPYCPVIHLRKLEDYLNDGVIVDKRFPTPATPYPELNSPYYNRAFRPTMEPYRTRNFVLEWYEGSWKDEYHIKVNTSYRGFWPTDVPDPTVENMYRFFGGVIQVLKVANNHLVLNFCMRLPHSKHFSVVLSRNENQLTAEDLAVIHNIFTTKHLSTSSLKRVCDNSATINYSGALTLIVLVISRWCM